MKIGLLDGKCGACPLIDFCTEPYETPQLCSVRKLEDVDTKVYKEIAQGLTTEEIEAKIRENEEKWSDKYMGAICDLVCEKMSQ